MDLDVALARSLTPACAHVAHFNNAGASPSPSPVLETVIDHLRLESTIGGYEAAAEVADQLEDVYASIARLVGGRPDEIALVENATRAWDMAFYAMSFAPGDRILTGRAEYASNLIALLQVAGRTGAVVEVIDDDEHGQISVEQLAARIDDRVRLIALTHVPTSGGLVNPARAVGAIAKATAVPFFLDACQSAGQLPLDVDDLGCDVLTATGRKFLRAPRGTGFLWVRGDFLGELEPPMLDLHAARLIAPNEYEVRSDARKFECWESSIAAKLGLGAAVDHALGWGIDAIAARIALLAGRMRLGLRAIPGVRVHDQGVEQCAIVTFTVDGIAAADVQQALAQRRINTSVSRREQAQLDLALRGLPDVVRASVHYFNDETEIDALLDVVAEHASLEGGAGLARS